MIHFRNVVISFFYRNILKRIYFRLDPEVVHDRMTKAGVLLGKLGITRMFTSWLFSYSNKSLNQDVLGIKFSNPIGLAAGFDKDAQLTDILPSVGFGFEEIGSITGEPCDGNPKPRLWRLKKSKSLLVNYGLKNKGAEYISKLLSNKNFKFPIGTSIAKTNCELTANTEEGIKDYVKAFKLFTSIGDYFTINISCPNAFGGQPFTDPNSLDKLFNELDKIETTKPIFIKISPDLDNVQVDQILNVCDNHRVQGIICSNLTKNRDNVLLKDDNVPEKGGMGGKVAQGLSDEQIKYIYNKTKGKYIIIGCGGVSSAEDAYKKIKSGATLVQMITGMIYEGPQVISDINAGLVKLLKEDGYTNISQAVGKL
jgi:dihydroorotate dehydrogenase